VSAAPLGGDEVGGPLGGLEAQRRVVLGEQAQDLRADVFHGLDAAGVGDDPGEELPGLRVGAVLDSLVGQEPLEAAWCHDVGGHGARLDNRGLHAVASDGGGEGLDGAFEGELGGGVRVVEWGTDEPVGAGGDDQAPPARPQVGEGGLDDGEIAEEVPLHHVPEAVHGDLLRGPEREDSAGLGDDCVDAPVGACGLPEQGGDARVVGDIEVADVQRDALGRSVLRERGHALRVAAGGHDRIAGGCRV
jgi:hypothetical protein